VKNPLRWVTRGLVMLGLALAVLVVVGAIVMLLWNSLVPRLFHGPALQYWQAVGLLLLSRILFGGWRGRGGWHGHWRQRMWRERWQQMTPEERLRLRESLQVRCGRGAGAAAAAAAPPSPSRAAQPHG
jgi:hypothetical protein